ncbi:glycoside hydrolase family 97 N-terminal domain-containing protein [Spirosoma endophyticum]|uniref:Glycosyl-hydrolase 97 N-terminal n=1 Tax=Spirosoma endophyticum TaxID=662367 RepID=A0A1I1L1W2_9BACT|nr:glycoside hydrolase family 97 N-terminal domain-containing protein [Spirosoma endophyticum]SFC66532.1 Glycosyl-hydrolase 97 N-terminal [Spirosoma endophyticum]
MKKIVSFCYVGLVLSLVLIQGVAQAAKPPYQATSPDGKTRMELTVNDQKQLVYRVTFEGNPVVDWSALGFQLTNLAVGENAVITKQTQRTNKEQVAWPLGEKDIIQNNYQELTLDCRSRGLHYKIIARVFDGSVAFRYVLPQQKGKEVIPEERTIFTLTDAYTIYQYNEESVFTPVAVNKLDKTCDFPATLTNGKFFISLGEASNDSYTKAVLAKGPAANSMAVAFLKDSVTTSADFQTPWRTISIATSAIGLHQFSDLPLRLTPPVKEV